MKTRLDLLDLLTAKPEDLIRQLAIALDERDEARDRATTLEAELTAIRNRRTWTRRSITPELLTEVAKVYASTTTGPTEAVRQHFEVSKATASRWVKEARDAGHLVDQRWTQP